MSDVFEVDIQQVKFEIDIQQAKFEIDLQVIEQLNLNRYSKWFRCGEDIIANQVVYREGDEVFVARPPVSRPKKIIGIALQSGRQGEMIEVLMQGWFQPLRPLDDGILFLSDDGFLDTEPPLTGNVITMGFSVSPFAKLYDNFRIIWG